MDETQARNILSTLDTKNLSLKQQNQLLSQLLRIDISTLRLQKKLIEHSQTTDRSISPFIDYAKAGNREDREAGKKLIADGQVGCLIVAGGQGSRLGIEGPKGLCEVTKVRKKSLFQLFAEKTLAAGQQVNRPLSLAIMTSPLNHEETVGFFQKNDFFGLEQHQICFFQQEMLPILDIHGNLFFETPGHLAEGPDGNGGALFQFVRTGLWQKWYSEGIRYLNFVLIDNVLADPFDAELIGYHARKHSDVVIKCIERKDPHENVGLIVQQDRRATVVEYTEISLEERSARNPDQTLLYTLANLSLFSFTMDFVKKADAFQPILHKSFKAVKYLDKEGHAIKADKPMAWKFERFIFDILPKAERVDALIYPREVCFAPLKNGSGDDSIETVREAIERSDQRILSAVTGHDCTVSPLEISQEFYYPTPELLKKWKGIIVSGELSYVSKDDLC